MGPGNARCMSRYTSAVLALTVIAVGGCSRGGGGTASPTTPGEVPTRGSSSVGAWAKWGIKPLPPAPAPPAIRPVKLATTGTVPVIYRIPTMRKVVFITIDDGKEKDPQFIRLVTELKIPITMFLMDDAIKNDYGYFKPLQAMGDHIQNHTLHHPLMSTLPQARQRQEVCGDQRVLTSRYGVAPLLFRPPYGGLNAATKVAVAACGPRAIVLWREAMQIHDMQYLPPSKKLRPGDIILAHFRGPSELKGETMTGMFVALLRRIQQQGFAVARLEDYIQAPRHGSSMR
jgi:peptidoglycan/xylan/chitin deacetylase (PgdA/CDA1 family)